MDNKEQQQIQQEYQNLNNAALETIKEAVAKAELLLAEQETLRKTLSYKALLLITLSLSLAGYLYETPTDLNWAAICNIIAVVLWIACAGCSYLVLSMAYYGEAGVSPIISKYYLKKECEDGKEYTRYFLCYLLGEYEEGIEQGRRTLKEKTAWLEKVTPILWLAVLLTVVSLVFGAYESLTGQPAKTETSSVVSTKQK